MNTTNTPSDTSDKNLHTLTTREWDVLLLVANDVPNKEIAVGIFLIMKGLFTIDA